MVISTAPADTASSASSGSNASTGVSDSWPNFEKWSLALFCYAQDATNQLAPAKSSHDSEIFTTCLCHVSLALIELWAQEARRQVEDPSPASRQMPGSKDCLNTVYATMTPLIGLPAKSCSHVSIKVCVGDLYDSETFPTCLCNVSVANMRPRRILQVTCRCRMRLGRMLATLTQIPTESNW